MENNIEKKKNGVMVLVIILIIIILGLVGFIVYKELSSGTNNNNNNSNNSNNTTDNNQEDNKQNDNNAVDTSNYKYTMNIYKSQYNHICKEAYCNILTYTVKTETENAKIVGVELDGDTYILYDENGLKLYNAGTQKIVKVNLNTNDDSYDLFKVDDNYLNISRYDSTNGTGYAYLLNVENGNIELEDKSKQGGVGYYSYKLNNNSFYTFGSTIESFTIEKIYNSDKKLFFENTTDKIIGEESYSFFENNLYICINDVVKKYDSDGKLINTSKKYDNFKQLVQDKIIYVKDNKLVVESLNDRSIKEIVSWSDNYNYDTYSSGYYSRDDLDKMDEPDKKEGLYLVIYYKSKIGDNYGMEYCYTGSEIITYPIKQEMGGRAKPVLYLYPTEKTKVKVRFAHPEYLTTTYPKYDKEWVVMASPNGDLIDSNNKYYYALYWDEVRYHEVSFDEGFYITKENAIAFLEEKLTLIGLNAKERNEFIMYWLPILENNGQSLVYFELTEERELNNKLIIEPTPDSLLRVNIHIKKVNEKVNIKEQKLESFKRVGFTAVEWGGMTY